MTVFKPKKMTCFFRSFLLLIFCCFIMGCYAEDKSAENLFSLFREEKNPHKRDIIATKIVEKWKNKEYDTLDVNDVIKQLGPPNYRGKYGVFYYFEVLEKSGSYKSLEIRFNNANKILEINIVLSDVKIDKFDDNKK